ncbi:hypothetical protein C7E12_22005, partial [Stenotrophomonas maltophilia]
MRALLAEQELTAAAESRSRAKSNFVAAMSHEIRGRRAADGGRHQRRRARPAGRAGTDRRRRITQPRQVEFRGSDEPRDP